LGQDLSLCKEITRDIIFSSSGSLAAQTVFNLGTHNPFFLTDNQQLVNFFNGNHHSNPPRWEIKNYTQEFINHTATNNARVFKVPRKLNTYYCPCTSFSGSQFSIHGRHAAYLLQPFTCNRLPLVRSFKLCNFWWYHHHCSIMLLI
jgi:hypothetical protein